MDVTGPEHQPLPRFTPALAGNPKVWFTSDTHFWHHNIIRYCKRPFASTDEMNWEMVKRWNARVGDSDLVFHLGDFSFGGFAKASLICQQLKGHKVLIRGNHDAKRDEWGFTDAEFIAMGFETVVNGDGLILQMPEGRFFLAHHPHINRLAWPEQAKVEGTRTQLCGHVHELWARKGVAINVGVDQRGFAPATIQELLDTRQPTGQQPDDD